jgi:hypothetical protein
MICLLYQETSEGLKEFASSYLTVFVTNQQWAHAGGRLNLVGLSRLGVFSVAAIPKNGLENDDDEANGCGARAGGL